MTHTTPPLGVSAWSFHDDLYAGRMTLFDAPARTAVLGFELVELNDLFFPPPRASRLRYLPWRLWGQLSGRDAWPAFQRSWVGVASTQQRLRAACDQARVRCVALTLNSDFTGGPRQQPAALTYVRAGLAAARALGAPILRVTSDRREKSDDYDAPAVLERVTVGLRQAAQLAQAFSIRLALENHWGLTTDPAVMLRLVRAVNSPWLGVCLDLGNFPPAQRLAGIELLAPFAIHAHAKAGQFSADGEEASIDYGAELAILARAGYRGPLIIEYEGEGDPATGVARVRMLVQRHWPAD